jgi:hypothetical protein
MVGMASAVMGYLPVGVNLDHSPDAGEIANITVTDCREDGLHLDGNGDGHRQTARDVGFERCCAVLFG